MGLRSSEALLLSTMHRAFARAGSSEIPKCRTFCALPVVGISEISGAAFPKATLLQSYWLQRTRSAGLGGIRSQPSCFQHRASPRRRLRPLNTGWPGKNPSTTKPQRMRGSWRRSSRNRPRSLKSCGSNSRANRTCLRGSAQHCHRPRRRLKQSLDELRVMRIAVHGAGADGVKNAPRLAPGVRTTRENGDTQEWMLDQGEIVQKRDELHRMPCVRQARPSLARTRASVG